MCVWIFANHLNYDWINEHLWMKWKRKRVSFFMLFDVVVVRNLKHFIRICGSLILIAVWRRFFFVICVSNRWMKQSCESVMNKETHLNKLIFVGFFSAAAAVALFALANNVVNVIWIHVIIRFVAVIFDMCMQCVIYLINSLYATGLSTPYFI